MLPNKLRLIVKSDKTSPTVTVLGNIRHETTLQEAPGKDGVSDVLDELFSYGTTTLDRLAFQKALDDIAASESAGYDFSLRVTKTDFVRGVELLADNLVHPALPAQAFDIIKQQTAEYLEGQMKSPGYQADRALKTGLLPPGDPALRGSDAADRLVADARRRAGALRGDVPPRSDDHHRHRRHRSG